MKPYKTFYTRSASLVYLSVCLSALGRFVFHEGALSHNLKVAGAVTLFAATMFLFLDRRKGSNVCANAR